MTTPLKQLLMVGCVVVGLSGCGRETQDAAFENWLGKELESKGPVKIVSLQSLGTAGESEEFGFQGKLEITENLYRRVVPQDEGKWEELRERAKTAGLSANEIEIFEAPRFTVQELVFCEPLATQGSIIEFSGRAITRVADPGNYEIVELPGLEILEGERRPKDGVDISGDEGKKLLLEADLQNLEAVKNYEGAITSKNLEAHSKGFKKLSLLATFRPGTKIEGVWRIDGSEGELGIEFTKQDTEEDGFRVEGFLFDPAVPQYQKPFKGRVVTSEDNNDPLILHLAVQGEEGGVPVHDEVLKVRSKAEKAGLINKTLGLLLIQSDYDFILKPSSSGELVGKILENDQDTLPTFSANPVFEFRPRFPRFGKKMESITYSDKTGTSTIKSFISMHGSEGRPVPQSQPPLSKPVLPHGGVDKRLVQLAVEAEPMAREISEAVARGDSTEANRIFQQMARKYPNAPQTLALRIAQANSLGDARSANQLYQKLKSYPLPESAKEQVEEIGEMILKKK